MREARENPELAVLSAMAHGRGADPLRALDIVNAALRASEGLDLTARGYMVISAYFLGEAARVKR